MKQSQTVIRARHQAVMEMLEDEQSILVSDAAMKLGVSELTVRRDFDALERAGKLVRFHGGARLSPLARANSKNANGVSIRLAEKAAECVKDGDVVFISGGEVSSEVLRLIGQKNVTIVTDYASAHLKISGDKAKLISTGGIYDKASSCYIGLMAKEAYRKVTSDVTLYEPKAKKDGSPSPYGGSQDELLDIILKQSRGVKIIISESSRIGANAFLGSVPSSSFDVLITDRGASQDALKMFREREMKVILA